MEIEISPLAPLEVGGRAGVRAWPSSPPRAPVESVARLFLRRDVAVKPVVFRVLWWRGLGSRPWAYNAALECLGQFATYKLTNGLVQPVEFGLYHFPCLGEYARGGISQPVTQFLGEARPGEQGVVLGHEIDA